MDTAAPRTFALIKRDKDPVTKAPTFTVWVKEADDFRHWPYRVDYTRHADRASAEAAAQRMGCTVLTAWHQAELTNAEAKASGY